MQPFNIIVTIPRNWKNIVFDATATHV